MLTGTNRPSRAMTDNDQPTRMLILGAAGRDIHNFNMVYRDDPAQRVVAFTATQIPDIAGRRHPPEPAGPLYPDGIPIADETGLAAILAREHVQRVVFAYSDVTQSHVCIPPRSHWRPAPISYCSDHGTPT